MAGTRSHLWRVESSDEIGDRNTRASAKRFRCVTTWRSFGPLGIVCDYQSTFHKMMRRCSTASSASYLVVRSQRRHYLKPQSEQIQLPPTEQCRSSFNQQGNRWWDVVCLNRPHRKCSAPHLLLYQPLLLQNTSWNQLVHQWKWIWQEKTARHWRSCILKSPSILTSATICVKSVINAETDQKTIICLTAVEQSPNSDQRAQKLPQSWSREIIGGRWRQRHSAVKPFNLMPHQLWVSSGCA